MDDIFVYRPYKTDAWALFFMLPVGLLSLVGLGYCLHSSGMWEWKCFFIVVGIVSIWLTKVLYDVTKKAITFEKNGLRIIGGSYLEYRYIPWEELTYGYYTINLKGHQYLLLSPKALNKKEARRFTNRVFYQLFVDYVVVIPLGYHQKMHIKELVGSHLVHIESYIDSEI